MSKQIGIWLRVSTENQVKGESLEHHQERASLYAKARGWDIKEIYRLEGVSGKKVIDHSETQRMLSDIRSGKITGLIFSKLARLARNTVQLLEFSDIFQEHGADMVSLQESIDTSSPSGRLFFTIIAAMCQWEREEIADRVRASVPVRASLGKPLGGAASFGYSWVGNELKINKDEAPVLKLMFEKFKEHKRKKTVAKILNDKGYKTRKGANFTNTTIERLLRNPVAKGLRKTNYTKSKGEGKHWEVKPKEDWVMVKAPVIVSEQLWNDCNAILEEQDSKKKKIGRRPVHLFSGFTFCHCGEKMYVPSNLDKYNCRKCKNKIPTKDLEEIYHSQIKDYLSAEVNVEAQKKKINEYISDREKQIEKLSKELNKEKKMMDSLVSLHTKGEIPSEGFKDHYEPHFERAKKIDDELPKLQSEIDLLIVQSRDLEEIMNDAKTLYGRWNELENTQKRSIIESITERITIGKDEITIDLNQAAKGKLSDSLTDGNKGTNGHGFIELTNIKFAG